MYLLKNKLGSVYRKWVIRDILYSQENILKIIYNNEYEITEYHL